VKAKWRLIADRQIGINSTNMFRIVEWLMS